VQQCCLVWRRLRVPVVAALHGVVFGAGLQLSLGADIRIAHQATQFSIMEGRHGLIPDMGITVSALGVVRLDHLKYLTYTAEIVGAEQAKEFGLTTFITDDDPLQQATKLAEKLAQTGSPAQLESAKRLLNETFVSDEQQRHSLSLEEQLQAKLLSDPAFAKRMASALRK
jgi:enoyl-CoA hydratase/carnithine racemase